MKLKWNNQPPGPIDGLVRFSRSKVKVAAGHGGSKGIHVSAATLKSIFCVRYVVIYFVQHK